MPTTPRRCVGRADAGGRDLAPAAGRGAEIDDAQARLQQMVAVVDLDQLVGGARAIALGLGALHVGVVEVALQPAARRFLQAALLLDAGAAARASAAGRASRLAAHRPPLGPAAAARRLPRPSARSACLRAGRGRRRAGARLGQTRRIASRMAQPASTRSARSAPMQGLATRASKSQPSSVSIIASTFGALHPQPVDAAAVVALEAEMDAGQRGHRAGGAEQMEARPLRRWSRRWRPSKSHEHARRRRRPSRRTTRRDTSRPPKRSASETTPTGSEVQATMWLASRGERWPRQVDQRDLGGAAADVEQHDAVGVALDQRAAAGDGEPRLGLGGR